MAPTFQFGRKYEHHHITRFMLHSWSPLRRQFFGRQILIGSIERVVVHVIHSLRLHAAVLLLLLLNI